jgi:Flp pilus assembly protein TadD
VESKIGLATIAMKRHEYSTARTLLLKALHLSPTNIAAYENLSDLLIREYQYTDAIDKLQKVIKQNEANGRAHGLLARAYLRSGDLEAARKELAMRDLDKYNLRSDKAFLSLVAAEIDLARGDLKPAEKTLMELASKFLGQRYPDDLLLDLIRLRSAQRNEEELMLLVKQAKRQGIPIDEIDLASGRVGT